MRILRLAGAVLHFRRVEANLVFGFHALENRSRLDIVGRPQFCAKVRSLRFRRIEANCHLFLCGLKSRWGLEIGRTPRCLVGGEGAYSQKKMGIVQMIGRKHQRDGRADEVLNGAGTTVGKRAGRRAAQDREVGYDWLVFPGDPERN